MSRLQVYNHNYKAGFYYPYSRIFKDGQQVGENGCTVLELQQRLHEKDMKLTDTQLDALSSAAQLEQLRDNMNRMKVRKLKW